MIGDDDEMSDSPDADFLSDPLWADEPIDLPAVRRDDALIDAIERGEVEAALTDDSDDELVALLAAWLADVARTTKRRRTDHDDRSDDG